ncbi:hypothetical protein Efla_003413 [Eimeria flavescens]
MASVAEKSFNSLFSSGVYARILSADSEERNQSIHEDEKEANTTGSRPLACTLACVRKTSCFLKSSHGIVLTKEPMNLTQKNTLRHSGLCHQQPFGMQLVGNAAAVKLSHKQKGGKKMRYPKRVVSSKKFPKTLKKSKDLQRLVAAQRPDLVAIAKKRFHKLCKASPKASTAEQ